MPEQILLVDVGNSNLKWAWLSGGAFQPGGELVHAGKLESESLAQLTSDQSPNRIVTSCVASAEIKTVLKAWAQQQYDRQVEFVTSPRQGCGLTNAYESPEQLGSDRWAAMVAAHRHFNTDVCIVDAGSAVTIDLLQSNGEHNGGYILPGLAKMKECLLTGTAISIEPESVNMVVEVNPGHSTESCISNGCLRAVCSLVESSVDQFKQQSGKDVTCIITGGDSRCVAKGLSMPYSIEPDLVLIGLAEIAKEG